MGSIRQIEICNSFLYDLSRFDDERGFFEELYSLKDIPYFQCKQINCSKSKANVIRGLHVVPFAKLVHCIRGRIFDVIVDMRKNSTTYLKWFGVELTENNKLALYVPPNCGHGFMSLEDDAIVVYAQDGLYDPRVEISVHFADATIVIKWPFTKNVKISKKDLGAGNALLENQDTAYST